MAGVRVRMAALVAVVLGASGCTWGMAGHGPERSGFSRFESTITPSNVRQLAEVWRTAPGTNVTSAPAIGNGKVFASGGPTTTTTDNSLVAFDLAGKASCHGAAPARCGPVWSVAFPPRAVAVREGPVVSPPSFDAGAVYAGAIHTQENFGQYSDTLAFDPDTGAARTALSHGGRASAAVGNGVLAASVTDVVKASPGPIMFDTLAVFDAVTGSERFVTATAMNDFTPTFATFSAPAVAGGVVYALASDHLYAFDANGVTNCGGPLVPINDPLLCLPLWSAPLAASGGWDAMPAVANGLVYVPELDGRVEVFPAAGCGHSTCSRTWSADAGSAHVAPVAVSDATLFVGSDDGQLSAFPARGCGAAVCQPIWTAALGSGVGPPSIAGSLLFVGTNAGSVAAFDASGCGASTCAPVWDTDVGAAVRGAPTVAGGRLVVSDFSGVLHGYAPAE